MIFFDFSLSLFCSPLGTLDTRRFRFPLPFPRPCLMSGHIHFRRIALEKKKKKREKKIRGGGRVVVPFAFSHVVHFGSPLVSSPFNTIHCTAPSCLLISVFLSRYLHALRFKLIARSYTHTYTRTFSLSFSHIYFIRTSTYFNSNYTKRGRTGGGGGDRLSREHKERPLASHSNCVLQSTNAKRKKSKKKFYSLSRCRTTRAEQQSRPMLWRDC